MTDIDRPQGNYISESGKLFYQVLPGYSTADSFLPTQLGQGTGEWSSERRTAKLKGAGR